MTRKAVLVGINDFPEAPLAAVREHPNATLRYLCANVAARLRHDGIVQIPQAEGTLIDRAFLEEPPQ